MNWEILGATGEWAGAIAVVASLLYLARQIKLSNQNAQAAARYSFLDAYGRGNAAIGETRDSASVFRRGLTDELADEDEYMQFMILIGQFLNTWSVMFDLHQEGQLPANQWALVRADILSAFGTPGGTKFWQQVGKLNVHPDFVAFVDELLGSKETTYSMLPQDA
jgi:hypothetical protein